MSRGRAERAALLQALDEEMRKVSAHSVLLSNAVAGRLGMNPTDLECLDILSRTGPVTAGQLAELTGLTTGAITGVVDRLETLGYVRREQDPRDRRRVIIQPVLADARRRIEPLYASMSQAMQDLLARYSDDELSLLLDFLRHSNEITQEQISRLRAGEADKTQAASGDFSAPLDDVTAGRLVFASGASHITLATDRALGDLFHARFEGRPPNVQVERGTVIVRYSRRPSLSGWLGRSGRVVLNASIPWRIEFRGGASHVTADLRDLSLSGLDIAGGGSHVAITLPPPSQPVPIRISGGASDLEVRRPDGVPVRVQVRGGVSDLTIDDHHFGAVGGTMSWSDPHDGAASERYDFTITGGASKITIARW